MIGSGSLRKRFGLITIVDALGTSLHDELQTLHFLKTRDLILRKYNDRAKELNRRFNLPTPSCYTFGDTIIFASEIRDIKKRDMYIRAVAVGARRLVVDAMQEQILFRGAIGIGDYYSHNKSNTVLGSAVADAAQWYDRAEWVGILCSPRLSLVINEIKSWNHPDVRLIDNMLVEYPIPTKNSTQNIYAVNWPYHFNQTIQTDKKATNRSRLFHLLSNHLIPIGTEEKYFNTISFYEHCSKLRPRNSKRRKPWAMGHY